MNDKCPITGLVCHNPKVIHVTDCGPDYKATNVHHLCQICGEQVMTPKEQPMLPPIVKSFLELMTLAMQNNKSLAAIPMQQPKACPQCGTTIQDIAKTSRLGCAHCYEYFRDELLPVLIHAHKAVEHTGKKPNLPIEEQIKLLELKLKLAIEHENYEQAQEIKNKLDSLRPKE